MLRPKPLRRKRRSKRAPADSALDATAKVEEGATAGIGTKIEIRIETKIKIRPRALTGAMSRAAARTTAVMTTASARRKPIFSSAHEASRNCRWRQRFQAREEIDLRDAEEVVAVVVAATRAACGRGKGRDNKSSKARRVTAARVADGKEGDRSGKGA